MSGVKLPWKKSVQVPISKAPTIRITPDEKGGEAGCALALRGRHVQFISRGSRPPGAVRRYRWRGRTSPRPSRVVTVSRTALLLAAASLVAGSLGLAGPAASAGAPATAAKSGTLRTLAVPAGSDPAVRALAARTTRPFSLLGLTWDDPYARLGGTAEVRTRDSRTGTWSGWRVLDTDVRTPESGPEHAKPGLRAGTQPLWTGPSDGVQLRASAKQTKQVKHKRLPDGLRVELVDPDGATPAPAASASATPTPTTAAQPPITARAGWGADESIVGGRPTYTTDTKALFIHHTAGTNNYTCAESAALIRSVFTYHVKSQGWNDIGYNFLVDKCGQIFEGRAGGIDKPVQGAHTYGFNTDTSSISVLGDYNTATTTPAVRESVARLAAWKLGLYGHQPSSTVTLTAGASNGKYTAGQKVVMHRISGHRDGYPTECPGNNLYADLPAIRTTASAATTPTAANTSTVHGDFNRDGYDDAALTFRTPEGATPLVVVSGSPTGLRTDAPAVLHGAGGRSLASGDLNGDGYADLVVGRPGAPNGGQIATFHGSPTGLTSTGAAVLDRATEGVPGEPADGDALGTSVAVTDTDADGYADVLAGIPGKDAPTAATDAGGVLRVPGSAGGLRAAGSAAYDTDEAGMPGTGADGENTGGTALAPTTGATGRQVPTSGPYADPVPVTLGASAGSPSTPERAGRRVAL